MDNNFHYKDNNFYVENVSVETIVSGVGTPCYIYSYSSFVNSFQDYKEAFSKLDPLICFSFVALVIWCQWAGRDPANTTRIRRPPLT